MSSDTVSERSGSCISSTVLIEGRYNVAERRSPFALSAIVSVKFCTAYREASAMEIQIFLLLFVYTYSRGRTMRRIFPMDFELSLTGSGGARLFESA